MAKADFPPELLVASTGSIAGGRGVFEIVVPLSPFTFDGERVEQSLEFRRVSMGAKRLADLAGRAFKFPTNPDPGYVETSVYLWSVHNPVDLRGVRFGALRGDALAAELSVRFAFDYEGGCNPVETVLHVQLRLA